MPDNTFIRVLTAPYIPHSIHKSVSNLADIGRRMTDEEHDLDRMQSPDDELNRVLYPPHGKWAWTAGLRQCGVRTLLPLRSGPTCSTSIRTGVIGERHITYISKCWSLKLQHRWKGFFSEMAVYKSERYLKSLQGDVIPSIIAVHVDPFHIVQMMELPHQSFWIEASPEMPEVLKERCIEAVCKIHACGVLHGNLQLHNLLIGGDGRVTVTDFTHSRALIPEPGVELKEAYLEDFRLEMRRLLLLLAFGDAREGEGSKTLRLFRLTQKDMNLDCERLRSIRKHDFPPPAEAPQDDSAVKCDDPETYRTQDAIPTRFVVPGQDVETVLAKVCRFLEIIGDMEARKMRKRAPLGTPTGTPSTPDEPSESSPSLSSEAGCIGRGSFLEARDNPGLADEERESLRRHSLIREENARRCKESDLRYFDRGPFSGAPPKGYGVSLGNLKRKRRDTEDPSLAQREKEAKKMKYKWLKEATGNSPSVMTASFKDLTHLPEGPRILTPEEYKARQKTVASSGLETVRHRSILRNRDADPGPISPFTVYAQDDIPDDASDATVVESRAPVSPVYNQAPLLVDEGTEDTLDYRLRSPECTDPRSSLSQSFQRYDEDFSSTLPSMSSRLGAGPLQDSSKVTRLRRILPGLSFVREAWSWWKS